MAPAWRDPRGTLPPEEPTPVDVAAVAAPPSAATKSGSGPASDDLYAVVHRGASHPEWDDFVRSVNGASYLQTSIWARVKAATGLRALRVVVVRHGSPVAGCQVLIRDLPLVGSFGYIPLGPVVSADDDETLTTLMAVLEDTAGRERIAYLKLQPPELRPELEAVLAQSRFVAGAVTIAPAVTVRIPLSGRSDDDLLAPMRASTRGNLRRGERSSVQIREGGAADLPTLQQHLEATAARQGFRPYPQAYQEQLWSVLAAEAEARLLLAEDDGEVLASAMLVGFGDTVVHKVGGWSGKPSRIRPNELIHWHAMRWARDAGYAYYDLGGISPSAVRALKEEGERARQDPKNGVAFFKLGLGGEIVEGPGVYDRVTPTLVGRAVGLAAPHVERHRPVVSRFAGRLR